MMNVALLNASRQAPAYFAVNKANKINPTVGQGPEPGFRASAKPAVRLLEPTDDWFNFNKQSNKMSANEFIARVAEAPHKALFRLWSQELETQAQKAAAKSWLA